MLGLRWFRDRITPDALARDHGISRATAYRYLEEVITVLADQAPGLREALERPKDEGLAHVILDGKVIPSDRCKAPAVSPKGEVIDLYYSDKAALTAATSRRCWPPGGFPLWVSGAEPGSVHDLTAARIHALPALYHAAADLPTLADPGYEGAGIGIHIPVNSRLAGGNSMSIPAPATPSSVPCGAWASVGSRCSPAAGAPSSMSPPAPAKSATSPVPPSSSPISSTATSNENR